MSRQKEEDKESKTRQHAAIKKERREDKWTEIKHSQTKTERKGPVMTQTVLVIHLN